MSRPPRPPSSRLLDNDSLRFIAISGTIKASVGVGLLAAMPPLGFSLDETRTALFLYESMMQLVFAYPCRRVSVTPAPNVWIHLAVWLGMGLQALTVLLPPLRALLGLVPLGAGAFASIITLVLMTWAMAELIGTKAWARRTAS